MRTDRIDFISAYCDRWCERCAFTNRCSAYAVHTALAMCDDDIAAAIELVVGVPPDGDQVGRRRFEKQVAEYHPTERELAEAGREIEECEERVDELPLTTDALVASTLTVQWLSVHRKSLEGHDDPSVRDAFKVASWDCHLIAAKLHRALSGADAAAHGRLIEDAPIQNDWNGSAKVALISLDRSVVAWNKIAATTADGAAAAIAERLQTLRIDVERAFPNARAFVRPGFDE